MMNGINPAAVLPQAATCTKIVQEGQAPQCAEASQPQQEGDSNQVQSMPAVFEIPAGKSLEDVQMPMFQEIGGRGSSSGGGGSGTV